MKRIPKLPGLAVAAMMLAMSVSAPAAFAGDFHSEKTDTTLTGSQIGENVITFNAGTWKCTEETYSGTGAASSTTETTFKLTPSFSGANEGSGTSRDIKINLSVSGMGYTQLSKSFPGCTNGTFANGTYNGAATVQGSKEGKAVGIWRE